VRKSVLRAHQGVMGRRGAVEEEAIGQRRTALLRVPVVNTYAPPPMKMCSSNTKPA
jgi:hypothetical protein